MMSLLPYSALWYAALPAVLLRLAWRARRQPEYLHNLGERFGHYGATMPQPLIWIHAVSVGETRAAQPLIDALLAEWPQHHIVLTHMTPTGRATGLQLYGDQPRVRSVYLPYDLGPAVTRFLDHFKPCAGIIMETELWPRLLHACGQHRVPVMLANARLSARSADRYARWPSLSRLTIGHLDAIGAQTADDSERLSALGARRVIVTGNIKFDILPPQAQLQLGEEFRALVGERPVILAASTRDGEEALILDAFANVDRTDALLLIVPRHPQRFDEVHKLIEAKGLTLQRRSDNTAISAHTQVWLGDSMGEMFAYYRVAQVALIGGSWLPLGGQNLIEACAVGTPVVVGPHTFNFELVAEQAIQAGAAQRCPNVSAAMTLAMQLVGQAQRAEAMRDAGMKFSASHRGATERSLEIIRQLLPASQG